MNAERLKAMGINYDQGVKRFMGKTVIYEKVLTNFMKDTALERARAAFDARDSAALLSIAHELKGASGNMEMTELYQASSALVSLLRTDAYTDTQLAEAFKRFESAYTTMRAAVSGAMEG